MLEFTSTLRFVPLSLRARAAIRSVPIGEIMRTAAAGLTLVAGLAGTASAQVADLTKATCAQLIDLPRNDRGQLIVWLHGYYAGAAQRPIIDRPKLNEAVEAFGQACERNRAMPLIGMEARAIFLGEPSPQTQTQAAPSPTLPADTAQNPLAAPNRTVPTPMR